MRINSLHIKEFRNLKDLKIDFDKTKLVNAMVGRNGTGKSNLMEAIAMVFKLLREFENEAQLVLFAHEEFCFTINYECYGNELLIDVKKLENTFHIKVSNDFVSIDTKQFRLQREEKYLPAYVIGYYAGENKRLAAIFEKYAVEEYKKAKKNQGTSDDLRYLFFTDLRHSQKLLLTLLLYRHLGVEDRINRFLKDYLADSQLSKFGLYFKHPDWNTKLNDGNRSVTMIDANRLDGVPNPFWNLKGKPESFIETLFDINPHPIAFSRDDGDDEDLPEGIAEILEMGFALGLGKLSEIYKTFPKGIDFFNAIESTDIVGVFHDLHLMTERVVPGGTELIDFYSLSEGEQQLITIVSLLLFTGEQESLFLFDEPDTFLNPKWQRDFVKLLREYMPVHENSQIFFTTHSPLTVQAAEDAQYLFFENGKVQTDPPFAKGSSINQVLLSSLFELQSVYPRKLDEYIKEREEIIVKGEFTDEDEERLNKLSTLIGELPYGDTAAEINAFSFIKRMEERMQDDKDK
jgi:predicted ATPase